MLVWFKVSSLCESENELDQLASLKEIETPGNLVDSTTVTPSGVGGNAAVTTGSASEHTAQRVCNAGMIAMYLQRVAPAENQQL
jgi:hypothetical protein